MSRRESGFTLVEIAIVLVIIGLLLGGILKGQELINSARVRNLADTASGVQAAYFGFVDRYRRVPGDWNKTEAGQAIGTTLNGCDDAVTGSACDDGRITNTGSLPWDETNAAWEQLSKAGFIEGEFQGSPGTEPTSSNRLAPMNPFNQPMLLGRTDDYEGNNPERLHLVLGRGIPVDIALELDTKMDDGQPTSGGARATVGDADTSLIFGGANKWGGRDATCLNTTATPPTWNVAQDSQDCNAVFLF